MRFMNVLWLEWIVAGRERFNWRLMTLNTDWLEKHSVNETCPIMPEYVVDFSYILQGYFTCVEAMVIVFSHCPNRATLEYDDVIKWKHFLRYWPLMQGIQRLPVNCPHKGQWREALMFSLICAWMNGWVNNRDTGYLRRHRAHYDVTVMLQGTSLVLGRWWLFFITAPIKQPWRIRKMNHINSLITLIHITDKKTKHSKQTIRIFHGVLFMMTSSNGNIFCVTGHLCGEFTGPLWIPRTKACDTELWCFIWSASE